MKTKQYQQHVHESVLVKLRKAIAVFMEEVHINWGTVYDYNLLETFKIPVEAHTLHKVKKGHHIHKNNIVLLLDHFGVPYEKEHGFINKKTKS